MEYDLTFEEVRVLAVLMEKQMTTPEYYPMTVNALKNGCNQKSNRYPVVDFDENTVMSALDKLRRREWVIVVSGAGSRVRKYEHKLREKLFLTQKETAALAICMLRGPQTAGEIRTRSERMVEFGGLGEVSDTLNDLISDNRNPAPLLVRLPLTPGRKERRHAHLLCGEADIQSHTEPETDSSQRLVSGSTGERIALLEASVTQLQQELATLRMEFDNFRKQFD